MKEYLLMRRWRPKFVNVCSDDARDGSVAYCNTPLDIFIAIAKIFITIATDECDIYHKVLHLTCFLVLRKQHQLPYVIMKPTLSSRYCIGPLF